MAGKPDDKLPLLVGRDGWPLGGPSDAELKHAAEARFKRDMQAALARLQGGDLTAFPDAIKLYWLQHPREFPYELVETSEALTEAAMAEAEKRARRDWHIARARWEALTELRERRHELARSGDDRGTSWERARAAVSEVLKNTEAAGSADAVKASYELIEAAGGERAMFKSFLQERHRQEQRRRQRRRGKPG